jgi:hypothetical protein
MKASVLILTAVAKIEKVVGANQSCVDVSVVSFFFSLGIYFWRCFSTITKLILVPSPFSLEFVLQIMDLLMFDVVLLETDGLISELPHDEPRSETRKCSTTPVVFFFLSPHWHLGRLLA